jgi:hypothetical protein
MDEVEALIREYKSESADKDLIIDELGSRLPDPRVRSWMLTVAADREEDPDRRARVLRDFEYYSPSDEVEKKRSVTTLLDLLQHESNEVVREYAALALRLHAGLPEVEAALKAVILSPNEDGDVRRAALIVYADGGDWAARVDLVRTMLADSYLATYASLRLKRADAK